jgi:hypothetical protein
MLWSLTPTWQRFGWSRRIILKHESREATKPLILALFGLGTEQGLVINGCLFALLLCIANTNIVNQTILYC